jgi:hypothetical protein
VFAADGDKAVWGTAYDFFGGGEAGQRACRAIGALAMVGQIDTTINNFLVPLQVQHHLWHSAQRVCRNILEWLTYEQSI